VTDATDEHGLVRMGGHGWGRMRQMSTDRRGYGWGDADVTDATDEHGSEGIRMGEHGCDGSTDEHGSEV